jgi:hypothetical protein
VLYAELNENVLSRRVKKEVAYTFGGFEFARQFVPDPGSGDGDRSFTKLQPCPRNNVVTAGRRTQSTERRHVSTSGQHVRHVERCCATRGHVVHKHAQFVVNAFPCWKPVKIFQDWSHVIRWLQIVYETGCWMENSLKRREGYSLETCIDSVTVVQPRQY